MSHTNISTLERNHPCFFAESRGRFGRIHLPVAPSCNIQCAYCRRDHDCLHENRPGVTNGVISPEAALDRLERTLEKMPHISVAGIAGPGDAFSEPELTLQTFELIRKTNLKIALCVSSNGLNLKDYIQPLVDLNVRFVTITVNTIDPGIGTVLCKMVNIEGAVVEGRIAAQLLIDRQIEAISSLKAAGLTVKVNSVVIPGINDDHILFLAKKMKILGVDLMNLLPLIPVTGTALESIEPLQPVKMKKLRERAGRYIPQMHHCRRCRSDAVGLLD